jgi:competence protein ComFC
MLMERGRSVVQLGNKVTWKDYLFPRFCLGCHKEGELWCQTCQAFHCVRPVRNVCPFCRREGVARTCEQCAPETYLDGLSALAYYGDPVMRRAIRLWKYAGDQAVQPVLLRFIRSFIVQRYLGVAPDVVTAIPLHKRKLRARGFDQAEEIAKMIAESTGLPYRPLLKRKKMTRAQAGVLTQKRLVGDLDESFTVCAQVPEKVLICDDVFTSGATMDAAAKCLKDAGVKEVWGVVLAKGSTGS